MGQGNSHLPNGPVEHPVNERLESWKEIAVYLNKGVRTVQRWEKEEGLPVHRHLHDKLGTVYAYKHELDAWWNNRKPRLEAKEAEEAPFDYAQGKREAQEKSKRWLLAGVVAVVVAVAAGVGTWWSREPALPFEERDWVLIADFENRTGEDVFDGALEYALRRELNNSRYVFAVPRIRAAETLRLMKKPPDARLTPAVAREVCLRDGNIRALVTGRVEKLDTTYVLSANLVNPASGVTVAGFAEEAEGQENVVPAVRRLASRLRERLGEKLALIEESEQELAKVTTPSLRALKLFSRGSFLKERGKPKEAEQFLREAIAEDPEFASAHMWLGYALAHQDWDDKEAYLPYAEQALELAETATPAERYFIRGSYYAWTEQYEKSAAAYEALLELQPDHHFAHGNLAVQYRRLGRHEEGAPHAVRNAELQPYSLTSQIRAARYLRRAKAEPTRVMQYVERANNLLTPEVIRKYPLRAALIQLELARERWAQGRPTQAAAALERLQKTLETSALNDMQALVYVFNLARMYMALGQLGRAEQYFNEFEDAAARHHFLSFLERIRGQQTAAARHRTQFLEALDSSKYPRTVFGVWGPLYLLQQGHLHEAEKALSQVESSSLAPGCLVLIRAELARVHGQKEKAVSLLEEVLQGDPKQTRCFLMRVEKLVRVLEEEGELAEMIAVLERALRMPPMHEKGARWLRLRARLAELYRRTDRREEAEKVEGELRRLLALADPDHPILQQIEEAGLRAAAQ